MRAIRERARLDPDDSLEVFVESLARELAKERIDIVTACLRRQRFLPRDDPLEDYFRLFLPRCLAEGRDVLPPIALWFALAYSAGWHAAFALYPPDPGREEAIHFLEIWLDCLDEESVPKRYAEIKFKAGRRELLGQRIVQ